MGRIFVAGGTGLVGGNLVSRLEKEGADFSASCFRTLPTFALDRYQKVDFTDAEQTIRALEGTESLVIAAAMTFGVKKMSENPTDAILPNLKIVGHLLEAARYHKIRRVVFLGSGTVYQEADRPVREDELDLNLPPFGLYFGIGHVSRYLEQLCRFYARQHRIEIGILRVANIYGPHDHFDEHRSHVIPALIKRAVNGENPFRVWGSPDVIRDFIYVEDVVEAILNMLKTGIRPEPLNLGSGVGVRIGDLVETVVEACGHSVRPIFDQKAPTAIPYRVLDASKFVTLYGPAARTSLSEGIRRTVEWYRKSSLCGQPSLKSPPRFVVSGAGSGLGRYLAKAKGGVGLTRENGPDLFSELRRTGCEVIIHAAFHVSRQAAAKGIIDYLEPNLEITRRLLEIPHRKFIYISSIDVYPKDQARYDENSVITARDVRGVYAAVKLLCEEEVMRRSPKALILRCAAFLGHDARKANLKLIAEDEAPRLTVSGKSRFNYVSHEDVEGFIDMSLEKNLEGVFNLTASENAVLEELALLLKKKVLFGDYLYDTGNISNQKAAAYYPAIRKTSRQVALEFLSREYGVLADQKGS